MSNQQKIIKAASDVAFWTSKRRDARSARRSIECENAQDFDSNTGVEYVPPCYFTTSPKAEWCEKCRSSPAPDEFMHACKQRQLALGRLVRAASEKPAERPQDEDERQLKLI